MKKSLFPSTESLLCNEVEIHYQRPLVSSMTSITQPKHVEELIRSYYSKSLDVKEHFWLISLTTGNRALGISTISVGTVNCTLVNVKEILQITLMTHATGIILVHNHPSGNLKPSQSDISITMKIKKACNYVDIVLLDHLIISKNIKVYS